MPCLFQAVLVRGALVCELKTTGVMANNATVAVSPALQPPPESREERREMYSVGAKILLLSDSRRGTIVEVKPGGWYDVKLQPLSQNGSGDSGTVSPRSQEIKTLRPTR
jgi:hypothetical protein